MVDLLKSETAGDPRADVLVTGLNGTATVTVRSWAPDASGLETVRERPAPARRAPVARAEPAVSPPPGNGRPGRARPYVPNHRRQRRNGRRATTTPQARRPSGRAPRNPRPCSPRSASAARARSRPTAICRTSGRRRSARTRSSTRPTTPSLGSIPAEKNRQPVSLSEMSPWMGKATVAIEDRRFYEHGGIDFQGIARAAYNDVRAGPHGRGRLHDHAAARPQPLHPHQERTLHRKLVEACLAIKLSDKHGEELDPRQLHEHRVLRQPRLRRRGRRADVLLAPREQALAPAVGAPRGAAAGAVGLRPVQNPVRRDQAAQRRAEGAVRERRHQLRQLPGRQSRPPTSTCVRGGSTAGSASPTSSATCATS